MKILTWDQYFMALAKLSGMRSKDPNTQVGAILVNNKNRVIGLGYNGMPKGNDEAFPWEREGQKPCDTKYPYVVHAEMNAILNAIKSLEAATLYVTLFPCSTCAKFIAQAGIAKIMFEDDKYYSTEDNQISKNIFKKSGIKAEQVKTFQIELKL